MEPRLAVLAGLVLLGFGSGVWAAACGANQQQGHAPLPTDTLRGMVEVAGADPFRMVVLRTAAGDLRLTGPAAEGLARASGAEVWVAGTRTDDGALAVEAYRVRAVGGMEAADGVLELDGEAAVLVTPAGRLRYGPAPAGLRALVGHRVWIAGPTGEEPRSWGVLEPPS
jgi:hypothetical protein